MALSRSRKKVRGGKRRIEASLASHVRDEEFVSYSITTVAVGQIEFALAGVTNVFETEPEGKYAVTSHAW